MGLNGGQPDFPQPDGGGSGDGGTNNSPTPDPGFYQVVQDGVRILNSSMAALTNGVLSNSLTIGFEAGNSVGMLDSATLLVDGTKFAGDGVIGSPSGIYPWQFTMDTAFLENGTHTVQVEVTWQNPDTTDGNNAYLSRQSNPFTLSVSNQIYYPQWEEQVGEAAVSAYFVKTTCTNADWHIDIYDVNSNHVQTLTGHTTDGTITAYWNMVDTNGVMRTNADLDPEFNSIVTVGDPAQKNLPPKKQLKNDWPDHGSWVIAYQDFFKFEYSANNDMLGAKNAFAGTVNKYGGYLLYYPQPGQTNDIGQTYPLRYQKTNHFDTNITGPAELKDENLFIYFASLTNARNVYLNGHGGPTTIASIPSGKIALNVKHRYRFVFMDGCETATGDLDSAFGIKGPGTFDLNHYQTTGLRPAAYCGYSVKPYYDIPGQVIQNGITYDAQIPWQVPGFIYNFLFYWDTEGWTLSDSINQAYFDLPYVTGWPAAQQPGNYLQIYGYAQLAIDGYNHKSDWP